jgi:hypothetical protein
MGALYSANGAPVRDNDNINCLGFEIHTNAGVEAKGNGLFGQGRGGTLVAHALVEGDGQEGALAEAQEHVGLGAGKGRVLGNDVGEAVELQREHGSACVIPHGGSSGLTAQRGTAAAGEAMETRLEATAAQVGAENFMLKVWVGLRWSRTLKGT